MVYVLPWASWEHKPEGQWKLDQSDGTNRATLFLADKSLKFIINMQDNIAIYIP